MHDGNESLSRKERRKFFVGNAFCWQSAQQGRRYQHDSDPRVRQPLINGAEQRHAEANVLLAEPNLNTKRLEQIVQLLGCPLPVVPCMAEKDIPKIKGCLPFDALADRLSARTSAGVYTTGEPARDQRGLALLPDPPTLLRPPLPLLPDEG